MLQSHHHTPKSLPNISHNGRHAFHDISAFFAEGVQNKPVMWSYCLSAFFVSELTMSEFGVGTILLLCYKLGEQV